jgi:hypothetical protein
MFGQLCFELHRFGRRGALLLFEFRAGHIC